MIALAGLRAETAKPGGRRVLGGPRPLEGLDPLFAKWETCGF